MNNDRAESLFILAKIFASFAGFGVAALSLLASALTGLFSISGEETRYNLDLILSSDTNLTGEFINNHSAYIESVNSLAGTIASLVTPLTDIIIISVVLALAFWIIGYFQVILPKTSHKIH